MGMRGVKHNLVKTEVSTGTEINHGKHQANREQLQNKIQRQPTDNQAVSHLTDKVATHRETPGTTHSQKNQARQSAKEKLSAEEKDQQRVNKQYNFKNQTEVPGEMTRGAAASAKQTLSAHPDIPALANLGSDKAREVALKVQDSQINDAKKEARLEIAKTGGGKVNKEIDAGGRDARVSVSGSFTEKIKRLPHKTMATDSNAVTALPPNTERHLNQKAHLEVKSELRQMKTELAESGETKSRQKFIASDGRAYRLQVGAEWKQNVRIAINEGDRTEWKTPEKDAAGYARSGQNATINQTAPTENFIASVKQTAARKATAEIGLEQQKNIENFVSESRQEMVSEGKQSFSDRKIVGNSAYDVNLKVDFDKKAVRLDPNKLGDTEKYIAANPQLSAAEITDLRRGAVQTKTQAINATVAVLKSDLAVSGDRRATTKVEIDGEKYKVKVKADWDVTAGHHKIQESDVKRYLRDSLVYNGGQDIKGQFKFGGRSFTGTGEVEYGLKVQKLKSGEIPEMDLLKAQRSQFSTQAEFQTAKKNIINLTTTTLNANTLDMRLDLARENKDKMTRVVTVNGESYRLTAKADWNVDAKRVKTDNIMTFAKIAAAVVGAATGQVWIPAAVSALDAAKRGDTLGLVTSGLSLAGGVTGGSLSNILNTSSRVIGAGAALTGKNTNWSDKLSAGASLVSAGTKFINPQLSNTISDIAKWGGRVNSVATGDWKGLLQDVATDAISNGIKNQKITQQKNSAYLNSLLQSGTKLGGIDLITGEKITPNKKIGGLKEFENDKDVSGILNANPQTTGGKNLIVPLPNYKSDGKGGIIPIPTDKASMNGFTQHLLNTGGNNHASRASVRNLVDRRLAEFTNGRITSLSQLLANYDTSKGQGRNLLVRAYGILINSTNNPELRSGLWTLITPAEKRSIIGVGSTSSESSRRLDIQDVNIPTADNAIIPSVQTNLTVSAGLGGLDASNVRSLALNESREIRRNVREAADFYNVPPEIVAGVLEQENSPDIRAIGQTVERGLTTLADSMGIGSVGGINAGDGSTGLGNVQRRTLERARDYLSRTYGIDLPSDVTGQRGVDTRSDIYHAAAVLRYEMDRNLGAGGPFRVTDSQLSLRQARVLFSAYNGTGQGAEDYGNWLLQKLKMFNSGDMTNPFYGSRANQD